MIKGVALSMVLNDTDLTLELLNNNKQTPYYKWIRSQFKEIELTSVYDIFDEYTIDEIMCDIEPEPKQCHRVSALMTYFDKNVTYVEGYDTSLGMTINHALNKIILPDGTFRYFDIVKELAQKENVSSHNFVIIKEYTEDDLEEMIERTGRYQYFMPFWYRFKIAPQLTVS